MLIIHLHVKTLTGHTPKKECLGIGVVSDDALKGTVQSRVF